MKRLVLLLAVAGCGPVASSGDAGAGPTSTTVLDAGCDVRVEAWPLGAGVHVPVGTAITWPSNPPNSGTHYPVWAAFQEFTTPVPRGYYVHDLEHGAVVFLYNCALVDGPTCEAIKSSLRAASDAIPSDGQCTAVRVRSVITPDPLLEQPLVAVSWGFIYRAQCVDQASLEAFAKAHYAHGPEDECANGVTQF